MQHSRRLAFVTTTVALFLACMPLQRARSATLPFSPPAGWTPLQRPFEQKVAVNWTSGESSFEVKKLPYASDLRKHAKDFESQMHAFGTVLGFNNTPVCGRPAVTGVTHAAGEHEISVLRTQLLGDADYVTTYAHPDDRAGDPHILAIMRATCSPAALAALRPPTGWTRGRVLHVDTWKSKDSFRSMILSERRPRRDFASSFRPMTTRTVHGITVTVVSLTHGVRCGNPIVTYVSEASGKQMKPVMLEAEMTQSSRAAYMLMYSFPADAPQDPVADTSFASLCANN